MSFLYRALPYAMLLPPFQGYTPATPNNDGNSYLQKSISKNGSNNGLKTSNLFISNASKYETCPVGLTSCIEAVTGGSGSILHLQIKTATS